MVNNPPAMQETWVRSLGWEDPLVREWLLTPVFWPGESHGLYSPWGHKELDKTKRLSLSLSNIIYTNSLASHILTVSHTALRISLL